MKRIIAILLALVLVLSLAACAAKPAADTVKETVSTETPEQKDNAAESSDGEFILGVQQPLSGDNAVAGQIAVNAIKLFVGIANKNGGWNGQQIKVVVYDDQSSSEEAVKVANKLIEVDHADAVIASLLSSNVLASAGYLSDAGIITIGIGTSPTWLQQGWENVFRACHSSDLVIPSLITYMNDNNLKTVACLHGEDDSSMSAYDPFVEQCGAAGIDILAETSYTTGDTDFSGQIAAMLNSDPDCIYLSTQGTILGSFMKQLRSFGYEGLVISKEMMTMDQLEVAGTYANGYVFSSAYVTWGTADEVPTEDMKEMYELYKEAWGEYPAQDCAFRAWDSLIVLQEALRIAGSKDTEAVRNAILSISGLKTLAGTVDYTDGSHEGLHTAACYAVEDSKYVPVENWDASAYLK